MPITEVVSEKGRFQPIVADDVTTVGRVCPGCGKRLEVGDRPALVNPSPPGPEDEGRGAYNAEVVVAHESCAYPNDPTRDPLWSMGRKQLHENYRALEHELREARSETIGVPTSVPLEGHDLEDLLWVVGNAISKERFGSPACIRLERIEKRLLEAKRAGGSAIEVDR